MTLIRKYGGILSLAIFILGLCAKVALSSGAAPVEEEEDEDTGWLPFAISSPASRNSLSAEILAKMRINLMGVMGIEPEEEDSTTSKGH